MNCKLTFLTAPLWSDSHPIFTEQANQPLKLGIYKVKMLERTDYGNFKQEDNYQGGASSGQAA